MKNGMMKPTLTPADFRACRLALRLSAQDMADALGLANGRTIRRYESGEHRIPGPVVVLIGKMLIDRDAAEIRRRDDIKR